MIETLKSGSLSIECDVAKGEYSLRDESRGEYVFERATCGAAFGSGSGALRSSDSVSRVVDRSDGSLSVVYRFSDRRIELAIGFEPLEGVSGFAARVSLRNCGDSDITGADLCPFDLDRGRGGSLFGSAQARPDFRFLRNGFLTWSGSDVRKWDEKLPPAIHDLIHDGCANPEVKPPGARGHFISEWHGLAADIVSGRSLAAGFITVCDKLSQVEFKSRDGQFHFMRAISRGEKAPVRAGGELRSEKLAIIPAWASEGAGRDSGAATAAANASLSSYASLAAKAAPPPVSSKFPSPPVGWCSWYFYYHRMTERVILENLEAAVSLRDRLPIDIFQIDDGYEPAPGDWFDSNKKFPHGLAWLNGRIKEAGFRPGLWLAPFFATNRSLLFRNHKDWFVRESANKVRRVSIWPNTDTFGWMLPLDTTHPDVLKWLGVLFSTIVNEWGYDYLKLDFLHNGATNGIRYDPEATRAQAFRRGLQAIRDAAGPETYILGCGIPIALGLGIVNAMRVSGDTGPEWHNKFLADFVGHPAPPSAFDVASSNFSRHFLGGTWGWNDPDCLMCRFEDTKLTRDEVYTHAAIVAFCGGPLFISDNLSKLTSESIRLASMLIPPMPKPAVPVDLFDSPANTTPTTLVYKFDREFDPAVVAGVFNWSDAPADVSVSFERLGLSATDEYHVFELWEQKYYGTAKGEIALSKVPAHGSRILAARPARPEPCLVAATHHFTQGGADLVSQKFDPASGVLEMEFSAPAAREGRVFISCPAPFVPDSCLINGEKRELTRVSGGVFSVDMPYRDSARLELKARKNS